jgi:hypothetical protein
MVFVKVISSAVRKFHQGTISGLLLWLDEQQSGCFCPAAFCTKRLQHIVDCQVIQTGNQESPNFDTHIDEEEL